MMGRRTLLLCLTLHLLLVMTECRISDRGPEEGAHRIKRERELLIERPDSKVLAGWIRMGDDDGAGGDEGAGGDDGVGGDEGAGGEAEEDDRDEKGNHDKEVTAHLVEVVAGLSTNLTKVWALLTSLEGRVNIHHPPPTTTTTTTPPPPTTTVPSLCWNPSSWCQEYEGGPMCSGRGECVCGECACFADNQGRSANGRFCECQDWDCDRYEGQVCGGPERGECYCGVCSCRFGYSGSDCSCPTTTKNCYNPADGKLCSGNGFCVCGACSCSSSTDRYVGQYCEESAGMMHLNWCGRLRDCFICRHGGPVLKNITQINCTSVTCEPNLTITDSKSDGMKECLFRTDHGHSTCFIEFHFLVRHLEIEYYMDRYSNHSCFRVL